MWIWQRKNWPEMRYDSSKIAKVSEDNYFLFGKLAGLADTLASKEIDLIQIEFLLDDVISSYAIEGEILERASVRSSLMSKLEPIQPSDRRYEPLTDLFFEALDDINQVISIDVLNRWHTHLFAQKPLLHQINIGSLRSEGPMQVVSGRIGKEKVHFEAPPREGLDEQLTKLLDYVNLNSNDNVWVKSAITHLWFEVLHPFDDGNGRLGRLLSDCVISKHQQSSHRLFSISSTLLDNQKAYYAELEIASNGSLDISQWIEWYINICNQALKDAFKKVETVIQKAKFWQKYSETPISSTQAKMINKVFSLKDMLQNGFKTGQYMSFTKTSRTTAFREIMDLCEKGVLIKDSETNNRNQRYKITLRD